MHPRVLSEEAWDVVRRLGEADLLDGWTLARGTGLALQLGHRLSEDLDLFRPEPFETEDLITALSGVGDTVVQGRSADTLHVLLDGLRVSFLRARPPLLLAGTEYRGLTLADPRDVAIMTIVAIGGRGSRKDFVDLYYYLRSGGTLAGVFELLKRRFTSVDHNEYHLLKSLCYFEDAETEPMPEMIRSTDWDDVRRTLEDEVRRLS